MTKLKNERGVALVTAMLFTLISLLVVLAVLYYITQSIVVSAAHKRYKTAREAAYGGAEVFTKDIIPQLFQGTLQSDVRALLSPSFGNPSFKNFSCITKKLNTAPGDWQSPSSLYGTCGSQQANPTNIASMPDMTFTLHGSGLNPNYKVSTKITDTVPGNTDTSGYNLLDSGAGVAYGDAGGVTPMHIPSTYRVEVQAQKETNPSEKAWLTVLYAY